MVSLDKIAITLSLISLVISSTKIIYNDMTEPQNVQVTKEEQEAAANFLSGTDPKDIKVNIGGKIVPLSKINKPHHVVFDPNRHHGLTRGNDHRPEADDAGKTKN